MNRPKYIFVAIICALAMTACTEKLKLKTGESFRVEVDGFFNDNDDKMQFRDTNYTKLLFQNGDILWVNGHPFELSFSSSLRQWVATRQDGSEKIVSDYYYCLCTSESGYDGAAGWNESALKYDNAILTENIASQQWISSVYDDGADNMTSQTTKSSNFVLAGKTEDSIIHLYPAFSILKFQNSSNTEYNFYVGFDGGIIPAGSASITPGTSYPAVTTSTRLTGVGAEYDDFDDAYSYVGDFLVSTTDDIRNGGIDFSAKDMTHIIVPCTPSGATSDIYIRMDKAQGRLNTKYVKVSGVHVQPGKVYTINIRD